MRRNCRYLSQDCPMTLREGIEELRKAEGAAEDASTKVSAELSRDLGIHDAIHVLFGCRTDLAGEVVAHVWTVFGTTARIRDLHRVGGTRTIGPSSPRSVTSGCCERGWAACPVSRRRSRIRSA